MSREKKTPEITEAPMLPEDNSAELTVTDEPQPSSPEIKTDPPVYETPVISQKKPSSLGRSLWRFIVFLFKLTLILALLGGISAALYFGLPMIYDRYILPVQQNTSKLAGFETQQAQTNQQVTDLQTQINNLQAQIAASATEQTDRGQAISDLETQMQTLEIEIETQTQSIAAIETLQDSLQSRNEENSLELERQIKLLKSMELLSRARLFLYQSNFGLARQDLQIARDILGAVQPSAPKPLDQELAEVVHRLDLTLTNLPNFPVAASDDLDIVWQILLQGLPQTDSVVKTDSPTSTPASTETPTSTLTLTPATVTPIPTATH